MTCPVMIWSGPSASTGAPSAGSWQFGDSPYWLATTGSGEPGINGGLGLRQSPGDKTFNSIGVTDADECARKVAAGGGKVTTPKMALPGIGWLVWCQDTEGNAFGVFQEDAAAA